MIEKLHPKALRTLLQRAQNLLDEIANACLKETTVDALKEAVDVISEQAEVDEL